jgi:hypothetical protein
LPSAALGITNGLTGSKITHPLAPYRKSEWTMPLWQHQAAETALAQIGDAASRIPRFLLTWSREPLVVFGYYG